MGRIQSSWAQEGIVLALRAFPWFALLHVVGRLLPLALPHAGAAAAAAGWWPLLRFYWAIEAVLFVEAAFLVYVQYRARVLDRTDRAPPQLSPAELELMFERLLRHTEDMKVRGSTDRLKPLLHTNTPLHTTGKTCRPTDDSCERCRLNPYTHTLSLHHTHRP